MLRVEVDYKIITNESEEVKNCMFLVSNDLKIIYRNLYIKGYLYDYIENTYNYRDKFIRIEILFIKKIRLNI